MTDPRGNGIPGEVAGGPVQPGIRAGNPQTEPAPPRTAQGTKWAHRAPVVTPVMHSWSVKGILDRSFDGATQRPVPLDRRGPGRLVSLDMTRGGNADPPSDSSEANSAFLKWLAEVPDSHQRYQAATEELAKAQELVRALSAIRSKTVAEEHEAGRSVRELSSALRMSPARAHQLIKEGQAQSTPSAKPAANRTSAAKKKPRPKRTGG